MGTEMVVLMVGVNHFDPLGRADLLARVEALAITHSDPPAFVALEFDQHQFTELAKQRPHFRKVLMAACPNLSDGELNALVSSLAYEGDTHLEVFPAAPVLWLDEGRAISDADLRGYADKRAKMYLGHAGGNLRGALEKISKSIKAAAVTDIDRDRTRTFADRILQRLHEVKGSWAIVITGEAHTSTSVAGSMRQLVEAAGVPVADSVPAVLDHDSA